MNIIKKKIIFMINSPNKVIFIGLIIILFYIIFIIYITTFFKKNISSDLISNNYYEEEIKYQDIINRKNNANNFLKKVKIEVNSSQGILIKFPIIFNYKKILGHIDLIRFSNKNQDIYKPLILNYKNQIIIHKKYLINGYYNIKIFWTYNLKNFLIEKEIIWKN